MGALDVVVGILALLVILTILVVVHEGGHTVAARLCGVRVTEFFVGMPCGRFSASRVSARSGIRYGVTPLLLGGYTRIAGMVPLNDDHAALVLALANARGAISVEDCMEVADLDLGEAHALLEALADRGSLVPVDEQGRELPLGETALDFQTPRRDAHGLTVCDRGHDFSLPGGTGRGEPYFPDATPEEFLAAECARTYQGLGFLRRVAILVAGVAVNIVLAFVIFVVAFALFGAVQEVSRGVSGFEDGSAAAAAGLEVGDVIVQVGDTECDGYYGLSEALAAAGDATELSVSYLRGDELQSAVVDVSANGRLGVIYSYTERRMTSSEAFGAAGSYVGEVAGAVASLLNPAQTQEVLAQSSGIVGIAVYSGQAAQAGIGSLVLLLGMLSLSLGWMNLLPIPPLDGGKVVLEIVELIIRRPVPASVQGALNIVGIVLFCALFLYMVEQDVFNLIL